MKTTDLIPILLYHLKDGDKYGLELVNACEECSDGKIKFKQPTLYSILKKLEKSRFISSYWKDSEIGGKRHYYKITDNGLQQLETYPPLPDLVAQILGDTEDMVVEEETQVEEKVEKKATFSPFDNISFGTENNNSDENDVKDFNPFDSFSLDSSLTTQNDENDRENEENLDNDSPILTEAEDIAEESIEFVQDNVMEDDTSSINVEPVDSIIEESYTDETLDNYDLSYNNQQNEITGFEETNLSFQNENTPSTSFDIFDALSFADEEQSPTEDKALNDNIQDAENETTYQEIEDNFVAETSIASAETNISPIVEPTNTTNQTNDEKFELNNPFLNNAEEKNLNDKTESEINEENVKIINEDKTEEFASDKKVVKFTQKTKIKPAKDTQYKSSLNEIFDNKKTFVEQAEPVENYMNIEYRDYVDFKTDKNIIDANKLRKRKMVKNFTSISVCLIAMILNLYLTIKFSSITPLFCVCYGGAMLYIIFYSCNLVGKYKTLTYKFLIKPQAFDFKKRLIIRLIFVVMFSAIICIMNGFIVDGSIFSVENYGNFYANIILGLLLFVDYFIALVFYKHKTK